MKGHVGVKTFSVVDTKFERRASSAAACSLRLPSLLQRDTTEAPLPLAKKFRPLRCCYILPHPVLRRAPQVGIVGLRNRTFWVLYGRRVIRFLGSALRDYWLLRYGRPGLRRLLPRRRQPPRRHGWRGHRPQDRCICSRSVRSHTLPVRGSVTTSCSSVGSRCVRF